MDGNLRNHVAHDALDDVARCRRRCLPQAQVDILIPPGSFFYFIQVPFSTDTISLTFKVPSTGYEGPNEGLPG